MDYFKGFNYDIQHARNFYLNSVKGAKSALVEDIKREIRNDLKLGKTVSTIYFNKDLITTDYIEELMENLGKVMDFTYELGGYTEEDFLQKDFISISH